MELQQEAGSGNPSPTAADVWLTHGAFGTVTENRFTKAVIQFNQSGLCMGHSPGWKQGKTTERW
jgi:hypothetical protein